MKKITVFLFVFLFLVSVALAETLQYDVNDEIVIRNTCIYNNGWCSISTICNITVIDSDKKTLINNAPMVYNVSFFFFELGKVNITGVYNAFMYCNYNGENGYEDLVFEVNKYGREINPITIIALILGLGITIVIIIVIASQVGEEHILLKTFLIFTSIFMTLLIPFYLLQLVNFPIMQNFYKYYLWVLRVFVAYALVLLIYKVYKGVKV